MMKKLILSLTFMAIASFCHAQPSTGEQALADIQAAFDIPDSITYFKVDEIPVKRAYIQWRTFYYDAWGVLCSHHHDMTYDFVNKTVLEKSDY
jgi:hypothetical protein